MTVKLPDAQHKLFKKMVRVTVEIHNPKNGNLGTGVTISPTGLILTAYHVVKGSKQQIVRRCELERKGWKIITRGRHIADVIFKDSKADVAVLKMRKPLKTMVVAEIGDSDDLNVTSPLFRVGRDKIPVAGGHVISLTKNRGVPRVGISMAGDVGGSGGPIFDAETLELVGLMLEVENDPASPSIAYAIPINSIKTRIFRRKAVKEYLEPPKPEE